LGALVLFWICPQFATITPRASKLVVEFYRSLTITTRAVQLMSSLVKLFVDAKACSNEDIVALSADNNSLREQVISLLLEIQALRETIEAQDADFRVLRYRSRLARK